MSYEDAMRLISGYVSYYIHISKIDPSMGLAANVRTLDHVIALTSNPETGAVNQDPLSTVPFGLCISTFLLFCLLHPTPFLKD